MIEEIKPTLLFCHIHNTDKEPLSYVCLAAACHTKGLLCLRCVVKEHSADDHKTISVHQLAEELQRCAYNKSVGVVLQDCLLKVKEAHSKSLNDISQVRQNIEKSIR